MSNDKLLTEMGSKSVGAKGGEGSGRHKGAGNLAEGQANINAGMEKRLIKDQDAKNSPSSTRWGTEPSGSIRDFVDNHNARKERESGSENKFESLHRIKNRARLVHDLHQNYTKQAAVNGLNHPNTTNALALHDETATNLSNMVNHHNKSFPDSQVSYDTHQGHVYQNGKKL